jgi:peptidoglycan/LPS O-acetylase OafA/YrhL
MGQRVDPVAVAAGPRLTYRPELDAIRGAAIALVLSQHFIFGAVLMGASGALGVTLFFVLSGYLITGLLLAEERVTGRVNLRSFYERRIRRLMPALGALVVVLTVLGIATQPWIALAYLSNWYVRFNGSMGLLTHTWTLGIEEQFYIVWPVAFLLLARSRRAMLVGLVGIILISVVLRDEIGSVMHADALAGGALLALWGGRVPRWLGVIGWVAIGILMFLPGDPREPEWTVGAIAAVAVVGSGLAPTWRPLVWLGTISYGLYLWNYPVAATILDRAGGTSLPVFVALMVAGVVLSISLAVISERWVERPFRRSRAVRDPDHGTALPLPTPRRLRSPRELFARLGVDNRRVSGPE